MHAGKLHDTIACILHMHKYALEKYENPYCGNCIELVLEIVWTFIGSRMDFDFS